MKKLVSNKKESKVVYIRLECPISIKQKEGGINYPQLTWQQFRLSSDDSRLNRKLSGRLATLLAGPPAWVDQSWELYRDWRGNVRSLIFFPTYDWNALLSLAQFDPHNKFDPCEVRNSSVRGGGYTICTTQPIKIGIKCRRSAGGRRPKRIFLETGKRRHAGID